MMKKFIVLGLFLTACEAENTSVPQLESKFEENIVYEINQTKQEILKDTLFEEGLKLTPTDPQEVRDGGGFDNTYVDTLDFGMTALNPIWRLAQWHSKYSLEGATATSFPDGSVGYSNPGKKMIRYPDNSLLLEVDASQEYDQPRQQGEHWPHLLIAQDFKAESPVVGAAGWLEFTMDIKLEKAENKMTAGTYDPSLHTAHTPFYFILKNDNSSSPDYNQRIWFGIRSYDFRHTQLDTTEKVSWDIGTNSYIYQMPTTEVWGNVNLHDKQWHSAQVDIKPWVLRALEAMQQYDLFLNTTPDDLKILGMNFGWEVPGTFDAAIKIKNIGLSVVDPLPDNFEREATVWAGKNTSPHPIGDFWEVMRGEWKIADPQLNGPGGNVAKAKRSASENYTPNVLIKHQAEQTQSGSGQSFSLAADVKVEADVNTSLAGIAFHVQDTGNYYAFRIGGAGLLQIIRMSQGTASAVFSQTSTTLTGNTSYRLEISSDTPYTFQWKVISTTDGTVLYEGTATDTQQTFSGGAGGLYSSSNEGMFDNFLFTALP